jgi:hypothetical protein
MIPKNRSLLLWRLDKKEVHSRKLSEDFLKCSNCIECTLIPFLVTSLLESMKCFIHTEDLKRGHRIPFSKGNNKSNDSQQMMERIKDRTWIEGKVLFCSKGKSQLAWKGKGNILLSLSTSTPIRRTLQSIVSLHQTEHHDTFRGIPSFESSLIPFSAFYSRKVCADPVILTGVVLSLSCDSHFIVGQFHCTTLTIYSKSKRIHDSLHLFEHTWQPVIILSYLP